VLGGAFLGDHFVRARLLVHGIVDREHRGVVVVLEDLLVIVGLPVNEHAADDHQLLALILRDDPFLDAVSNRLGDGVLSRAEHVNRLLRPLDGDLGDHHGRRLDGEIRGEDGQQVAMPGTLPRQGIRERDTNRAVLVTDEQINVSHFVTFAAQRFADIHRHGEISFFSSLSVP